MKSKSKRNVFVFRQSVAQQLHLRLLPTSAITTTVDEMPNGRPLWQAERWQKRLLQTKAGRGLRLALLLFPDKLLKKLESLVWLPTLAFWCRETPPDPALTALKVGSVGGQAGENKEFIFCQLVEPMPESGKIHISGSHCIGFKTWCHKELESILRKLTCKLACWLAMCFYLREP